MTNGTLLLCHKNLANVASAKNYLLRAFTENMKQIYSILTNIWMFEAHM